MILNSQKDKNNTYPIKKHVLIFTLSEHLLNQQSIYQGEFKYKTIDVGNRMKNRQIINYKTKK